jgi:phosphoadenosine phosphosulfate reductase
MNMTLPGMEPTREDVIAYAMSRPLDEKIRTAIALLQGNEQIALSMNQDGYWLAFSGGKDSEVIKELAKMAGIKYRAVYNVTTIDAPELVRHIQLKHIDVEWSRPKRNLIMQMQHQMPGPPTRQARWCCEMYKEHGGDGMVKIIGVRAAESARRAVTWSQVTANRRSGVIVCPIIYWTDDDVWEFIRIRNIAYCSLYDEGFKRLGCIGCPMVGENGTRAAFDRWPGFERLWKIGFRKYWDRWHGVPRRDGKPRWFEKYGSVEELWRWWISRGKWDGKDDECQSSLIFVGGETE